MIPKTKAISRQKSGNGLFSFKGKWQNAQKSDSLTDKSTDFCYIARFELKKQRKS